MKFYIKVNLLRTPTIWLTRNKRKFYNVSFYAKFHASNNVFYCWFGKKAETLTHAMSVEGSERERESVRACVERGTETQHVSENDDDDDDATMC